MLQLLCHHGHQFDVAVATDSRVVCPLCGSVTTLNAVQNTPAPGALDKTLVPSESSLIPAPVSGQTVLVEVPPLDPAVDLPARPVKREMPLTKDNLSVRTVNLDAANPEATAFAKYESAFPTPGANPWIASKPDLGVAKPGTADIRSAAVGTEPEIKAQQASGTSRKSFSGLRTKTAMQTEVEITKPPDLPGYKVVNELGRGGMGVVYRVYDEKLDRQVALKTLQRLSPVSLQRFKQEFRALADVSHPNLAAIYDLLSDGETWCFTMEVLEAVDFLEFVWSRFEKLSRDKSQRLIGEVPKTGTRLSLAIMQRLYDGLKQLALGLHALHEAGVLHRDIKPSNILVTKEGRVVLVDFGLASQIEGDGRPQGVQGTPDYMAPEQAAGKPVTPASDWYAVGVMLYELLTGRMPIEGKALQVIFKKQIETPKEPRELEPSVPVELNDLCMALLQKDPTRRPDVFEVLRHIGANDIAETLRGKSGQRSSQSVQLVGREKHLAKLREAFAQVQAGATRSLFVHGKSGMGKSVLIQTFLEELKNQQQAVVLTGRCYEQESVPFKALDSLIDSLAEYLGQLPEEVIRPIVPEDSLPLVRLFPVLGQMPGATDAGKPAIDNVDQQELRQRAITALRELLTWLGARQPVVLSIDDFQWGDVDSAALLVDLVRPPDSPRILLIGSYRSEYIETSSCLKALTTAYTTGQVHPHRQELVVEALREEDATRLALLLLKREDLDSIKYASKIARESGGWPFFVWELVQHVQEASEIADQTLELDEVIWTRVCRLPVETRRLLELIAVAGRPIVLAEAYKALDVGAKGQNLLVQLRTRNLIRATESENESTIIESYHDRIRESVVQHLDERTTKRYNLLLAETILQLSGISVENLWAHLMGATPFEVPTEFFRLERQQRRRVFDLSHFFSAAGEHGKALPFALIAAEQARQQNALEVAEQQYHAALLGSVSSAPPLRFRILEGLGDVLMLRGRYPAANEQLQAARTMAKDNETLARIDGQLGALAFKQGDMGTAGGYLDKALRLLNERPPTNFVALVLKICKEGTIQLLHTFFASRFVGQRKAGTSAARLDLFRSRLFGQFTYVCWFSRGMELTLWSHLRQLNLAERYPPTGELAKVYAFHSIVMTGLPLANRGIDYATRSHDIWKERGDLWGQGQALSFHTFSFFVLGQPRKAVETSQRAVELLEQAGDVWEGNMARMMNTWSLYHVGDLKSAYRQMRRVIATSREVGDYSAMAIGFCFWMQIHAQSAPPGAMQTEVDRPREDPLSSALAIQGRGLEILLREDNPLEAAKVLQDSLDLAQHKSIRNVCVFASATWKVTALRMAAERESDGSRRRRIIKQGKKAARSALRITWLYRICRAHLLRECGLLATLQGNEQQARTYFDQGIELAEAQGAERERAKTLLARGEAGLKFGWPDADKQTAEARALVEDIETIDVSESHDDASQRR